MQHKELGRDLLQKIYQPIEDIAAMESTPKVRIDAIINGHVFLHHCSSPALCPTLCDIFIVSGLESNNRNVVHPT